MKITTTIHKDTKAWQRIRKNLLEAHQREIKVGFFEGSHYPNGRPVATVARWQEQGTVPRPGNSGIPPRPFMREGTVQTVRSGRSAQAKVVKGALKDILIHMGNPKKGSTYRHSYARAGKELVKLMRGAIRGWKLPPNAPSTVASKGFNNPLVETDRMHDSVDYRIE